MEAASFDSENTTKELDSSASKAPIHALTPSEIIEQCVLRKLQCCAYKEMHMIRVSCEGDTLILSGEVPSFFLKQLAQEIAKSVPDVDNVCNECVVATTTCE